MRIRFKAEVLSPAVLLLCLGRTLPAFAEPGRWTLVTVGLVLVGAHRARTRRREGPGALCGAPPNRGTALPVS